MAETLEAKAARESKVRTVQRYRQEAIDAASKVTRQTYKEVKHMDKIQFVQFLQATINRGFQAGYKAAREEMEASAAKKESEADASENN